MIERLVCGKKSSEIFTTPGHPTQTLRPCGHCLTRLELSHFFHLLSPANFTSHPIHIHFYRNIYKHSTVVGVASDACPAPAPVRPVSPLGRGIDFQMHRQPSEAAQLSLNHPDNCLKCGRLNCGDVCCHVVVYFTALSLGATKTHRTSRVPYLRPLVKASCKACNHPWNRVADNRRMAYSTTGYKFSAERNHVFGRWICDLPGIRPSHTLMIVTHCLGVKDSNYQCLECEVSRNRWIGMDEWSMGLRYHVAEQN